MVKIKHLRYLSYNAKKWLQLLDLKAMVIYTATNDVTFIVFQNFTNM